MLIWVAETTVVTAIMAIAALAIGRKRSLSPSIRHALWLVVLVKFVTPPVVAWPWAFDVRRLEWPAAWHATTAPAVVAERLSPGDVTDAPEIEELVADDCAAIDRVPEEVCDSQPALELVSAQMAPESDPADAEPADEPAVEAATAPPLAPKPAGAAWQPSLPSAAMATRGLFIAWLIVSVALGIGQAVRILRFRRRLRGAFAAPDFLIDEADRIGHWLGVAVPELLMVDDLGTPMLWCLGRPQLLLPTRLVKTLPVERWRGILTHELAHLRRHDHWISRLELATGLIWWWNPLYWLTRARLDAEAELACDAWVVWALPKDRLSYAQVLFDVCSTLSLAKPLAPMLSVAGSGRFFERRLTMILHNRVPCRLSPLGLLAASLLLLVALPTWSAARLVDYTRDSDAVAALAALPDAANPVADLDDDDDKNDKSIKRPADDDDDDDADDDDNDDEDDDDEDDDDDANAAALARARARAEAARARVQAIERKLEAARARRQEKVKDKDKDKVNKGKKSGGDFDIDIDLKGLEKELESKFGEGSDFAKQMEEFGEKLGKELEAKLGEGSDFAKAMEKLGETLGQEIESKFGSGSEFEQKMKKLGNELESKLGEGSEFAKKMEAFGKEMEAKFGEGSEFEQKMKKLGEEMKEKYGPGSDFAKKLEEKAAAAAKGATRERGDVKTTDSRERRIAELEAQVAKLMEQIKALKSQGAEKKY
jgi:beta-lactamase regulating signal transducer with metallopeptidase domain